jgi:hypothetical protein
MIVHKPRYRTQAAVLLGVLSLTLTALGCGSAGTDSSSSDGPGDGIWIAELDPESEGGSGRLVVVSLSGNTIRYDQIDATVQFYGKRGTFEVSDGQLTASWDEALIPHTTNTEDGESYTPLWVSIEFAQSLEIEGYDYRDAETVTWASVDTDHVLGGAPGDESVFTRFEPETRLELEWFWFSADPFGTQKALFLWGDRTFQFQDGADATATMEGEWGVGGRYLVLQISSKAGYFDDGECDFLYVSPYILVGEGPGSTLTIDRWNGTWEEPSCQPVTFSYALF